MKPASKMFALGAAISMAVSPAVTHAGTRAASSAVDVSMSRAGAPVDAQNELGGESLVWLLLLLAAIAAIVVAANGKSRG